MATPVADSYSCATGDVIAGGRNYLPLSTTAIFGDSLTAESYGIASFYWLNGLTGGGLKLVANAGVGGDTLSNMLTRVDNAYTAGSPGLSGTTPLGYVVFRGGTNNARSNATIASIAATYTSLLNAIATYADRVIILAVPPLGESGGANNGRTIEYNEWLEDFAAANSSKFRFVDDCIDVRDGADAILSSFFNVDGVHFNSAGVMQAGLSGAAAFDAAIGNYSSPLAQAAEAYPAQPQWFVNPANAGTSGTASGGFSGTVASGMTIAGYGGGITGVCSIVSADVGDTNQTPWQRVTPSAVAGTGSEAIRITSTLAGRSISSSDPAVLEQAFELRLNEFDTSYFDRFVSWVQGSAGVLTGDLLLKVGNGSKTLQAIARHALDRKTLSSHTGATLYLDLKITSAHTGAIGSFDVRNVTVRG